MANPNYGFAKVKRAKSKASILIEGLSGRGKSGLALILAKALANDNWEDVYAIDTENGSLKLYDGLKCSSGGKFSDFNVAEFNPELGFKPSHYLGYREAAIESGAKVLIQDSITHAWSYSGGILDMVAELKKNNTRYQKDSYAAWGDDMIVKEKNLLFELFRDRRCHVISTVRVKEKMEYDKDENGKTILASLGEQQIMQNDVKYEPDLVLHMIEPGGANKAPRAKVVKSRYAILEVDQTYEFTEQLCNQLAKYLDEGVDPDALLEQQRKEYVDGIKDYLDNNKQAIPLWNILKKDAGFESVPLADIDLNALKQLFVKLTMD